MWQFLQHDCENKLEDEIVFADFHIERDRKKDTSSNYPYKEAFGNLMFPMTRTTPNIAFICRKLRQFMDINDEARWTAVKRIHRHLKVTINRGIVFDDHKSGTLEGYCDADYAGYLEKQKSTSGYIFTLIGRAAISNCLELKNAEVCCTIDN